jgi:hypothetical protein
LEIDACRARAARAMRDADHLDRVANALFALGKRDAGSAKRLEADLGDGGGCLLGSARRRVAGWYG